MSRPKDAMRQPAPRPTQYVEDFFTYESDFTLAAAATGNQIIQIQADSDFKWVKATYQADLVLAAQTDSTRVIPLVTIVITDTGSGRQLMAAPVPVPNLFGTGEIPFILPVPRIFKARTAISLLVVNYSAATAYGVRLSFIGTKLYPM